MSLATSRVERSWGWPARRRSERDLGEMLDDFHAVKSGEKIGTAGDRAMIGKKKSVVVRDVRFQDGAEIGCAGSGVADERNFAEADNDFREERLIESLAGSGESGGSGRMSVTNSMDIRAHLVEREDACRLRKKSYDRREGDGR